MAYSLLLLFNKLLSSDARRLRKEELSCLPTFYNLEETVHEQISVFHEQHASLEW